MPRDVDSDDDAPPPRAASCRACGHDHAPGTTCGVCGHHRRVDDDQDDLPRPRLGHDEPIIEVIDKFLCLGAFEHTSKEDVLLACGIRTVMNVRVEQSERDRARDARGGGERGAMDGRAGKGAKRGGVAKRARRARRDEEATRANGGKRDRRRETTVRGRRGMGGRDRRARRAVTDERRDARERTERAAVHAVL